MGKARWRLVSDGRTTRLYDQAGNELDFDILEVSWLWSKDRPPALRLVVDATDCDTNVQGQAFVEAAVYRRQRIGLEGDAKPADAVVWPVPD